MLSHEDRVRLQHMRLAAGKALRFVAGRSRADLDRDEQLTLALTRLIEIVGEAANAVSEEWRQQHQDIPWRAAVGARNRLIHGYFDVDLDVVWQIVSRDLPTLAASLDRLLSER